MQKSWEGLRANLLSGCYGCHHLFSDGIRSSYKSLFRPETFGNQVGDQQPEQAFDQKKKEPSPAKALKPQPEFVICWNCHVENYELRGTIYGQRYTDA